MLTAAGSLRRVCPSKVHAKRQGRAACPLGPRARLAEARSAPAEVRLICTDVDGTLLDSQQRLSERVERAVRQAAAAGVPVCVATGKARGPWAKDVLPRLGEGMPGVFLQGLLVCDAQGNTLYSRDLEPEVAAEVVALARKHGVQLTAYCGDRIIAETLDQHTERLKFYREPDVEAVGSWEGALGVIPIQKMIFMAEQHRLDAMRQEVDLRLGGRASLTVALEGMLEVLPLGASKGAGVAWLLEHLGVEARHVLALGDGDNDVEMLRLVGWGVAMGNAGPGARAAAAAVVGTNDEGGVAEAIDRYVLRPRGLGLSPAQAAGGALEAAGVEARG